jgi:hypothetical protein
LRPRTLVCQRRSRQPNPRIKSLAESLSPSSARHAADAIPTRSACIRSSRLMG